VLISSNISLSRDLAFGCRVIGSTGGSITANGFTVSYNPAFPEPFAFNSKDFGSSSLDNSSTNGSELSPRNNKTSEVPSEFSLSQNYPNPFNPSTKISFAILVDSKVSLKVYDITGKLVSVLAEGSMQAGLHTVTFNSGNLSSGVYFYTLTTGDFSKTMKMILTK